PSPACCETMTRRSARSGSVSASSGGRWPTRPSSTWTLAGPVECVTGWRTPRRPDTPARSVRSPAGPPPRPRLEVGRDPFRLYSGSSPTILRLAGLVHAELGPARGQPAGTAGAAPFRLRSRTRGNYLRHVRAPVQAAVRQRVLEVSARHACRRRIRWSVHGRGQAVARLRPLGAPLRVRGVAG